MGTRRFICILLFATAVQINGQSTTEWTSWGSCSATCRFGSASPTQTRSRTCTGNCNNVLVFEMRNCNDVSCQVIPCNNVNISYIIVIDSSSSVKTSLPDEWSQEKTFVKNFAAQLGVGTNPLIRVGLVNYGTEAEVVATCDSVQTSTLANFNAFIDGLPRKLGGTAINDALLQTRALYQGDGCNRQNEVRVVLFLTDGYENIQFNDRVRFSTENLVRSEAGFCVGAVGPDPRINDLLRLTSMSYITRTANFEELSQLDVTVCHNQILNKYCAVPGSWTAWSNFGACSVSCGGNGTRTRSRQCVNPITNAVQNDCPGSATESEICFMGHCVGSWTQWSAFGVCSATCHFGAVGSPPTQMRTRACVGATGGQNCGGGDSSQTQSCNVRVPCPGNWGQWSAFGDCSEQCQSDVNNAPTRSRTRTCSGGTFNGGCVGSATNTTVCNARVPCQGSLTQWSSFGACSASCQLGLVAPTQERKRSCLGSTFGGNCNNAVLTETADCNVEVRCPGVLTNWGQWGACSENCQSNPNQIPTRMRSRQCINFSFGGNCEGAALTMTEACNVGVGCAGMWSNWGAYESCSETCQSNVNTVPTQIRRRTCNGGTFGQTCPGSSVGTRNCSERAPCPGNLTPWSPYGACSASCQLGLIAPTQQRTRSCIGATFGGNCNNAALSETTDCNVEVSCPGNLSQWSNFSMCPESCQTGSTAAQHTRTRNCTNTSFGGNCGGAFLTESQDCSAGVACPGTLTQWSSWSDCSATCHAENASSPIRSRTRLCQGATLGGNCGGASLLETVNCNFQAQCPGRLTTWGPWTACSHTCQSDGSTTPSRSRARFCVDTSFGGNCLGANLQQSENCNVGVICPVLGTWTPWGAWSTCSKTCDMGMRTRSRNCTDPFPANAGNDCVGSSTSSSTCKLADCPVACPVTKRCNCSLTTQFPNAAPTLSFFNIDDATIHAAINTMSYWTEAVQNQICESCNLQRLQVSVNTVNSHVTQVKNVLTRLNEIKRRLKDIINCNKNVFIGSDLWALYDYLYTRCTMLKGIHIELSACKLRFDAANNSCKKFGWFHQLVNQVYRKL